MPSKVFHSRQRLTAAVGTAADGTGARHWGHFPSTYHSPTRNAPQATGRFPFGPAGDVRLNPRTNARAARRSGGGRWTGREGQLSAARWEQQSGRTLF
mmetsp:Transcript_3107/g.5870  ORF Transcript_3107/g.5870 Transcript_3107/m.5870 type:complete len:98 (-) Transcript_3107:701-994(-)